MVISITGVKPDDGSFGIDAPCAVIDVERKV
jgi:hypothetical protein